MTAPPGPTPARPRRRRSRSCCACCLVPLLLVLLGAGAFLGAAWWLFTPAPSPVQVQYDSLPEYFPPEATP